jgi:hypothetical protein
MIRLQSIDLLRGTRVTARNTVTAGLMIAARVSALGRHLVSSAAVVALCGAWLSAAVSREYEVKAAFLFNFATFVNWPTASFESAEAPFRLCVAGIDPFGSILDDTIRNEKAGTHPMVAVRNPALDDVPQCHILFVPARTADVSALLHAAASGAVFTVGESDDFLKAGGALRFVIDEGRVRFDIHTAPATKAGVALTSRLLQVARDVK